MQKFIKKTVDNEFFKSSIGVVIKTGPLFVLHVQLLFLILKSNIYNHCPVIDSALNLC